MSISADFHLHTDFSSDSDTPMEDMILSGISKGLKTMCFTEHMDYDYPIPPDNSSGKNKETCSKIRRKM